MRRRGHEHEMTEVMATHDRPEACATASRGIAVDRPRNRPDVRGRYGATVANGIAIWPLRLAERLTTHDAELSPGQDDLTSRSIATGTTRANPGAQT